MKEITPKNIENVSQKENILNIREEYKFPISDPYFRGGQLLGEEFSVKVDLAIHPNLSNRIIINMPGAFGDIDGYVEKYKNLANYMQLNNLGAIIRTDNIFIEGYLPDIKLRSAIKYAEEHALEICGEPKPEIMLMGFSAGASAIASIAYEFPEVSRILLYAPSGDMSEEMIKKGLKEFKGEVVIVQGDKDQVVGPQAGKIFYDLATGASNRELFMVANCDHQFKGEVNGRIMSEAPFYAFTKDSKPKFPDPRGGIKLYE